MKRKSIVLTGLLAVLLMTGGFFAYKNDYFASTDPGTIDIAALAKATVNQTADMPKVQINYSKKDIERALYAYRNTQLANISKISASEQKIITEIQNQSAEISNQSKTLNPFFILLDKDNLQVSQNPDRPADTSVTVTNSDTTRAEDNFDFAADVPQTAKNILGDAYPKVDNIYGKRSNIEKIKVYYKYCFQNTSNSCYNPSENAIYVAPGQENNKYILTHELVHSFHGSYVLRPLWEEGMTVAVAQSITTDGMHGPSYNNNWYEINNIPENNFERTLSVNGGNNGDAYSTGFSIVSKLYIEDANFFKKFNAKLYKLDKSTGITDPVIIKLISGVTPKVEGQATLDWFSHQYAVIYPNTSNLASYPDFSVISNNKFGGDIDTRKGSSDLVFTFEYNSTTKYLTFDIFDNGGTKIANCEKVTPSELNEFDELPSGRCATYKSLDDYVGLLKIVTVQNSLSSDSRIEFKNWNYFSEPTILAQIPGSWQTAKVTNLDTGYRVTADLNNGLLTITDKTLENEGRYKLDVSSTVKVCQKLGWVNRCTDQKKSLNTYYFNKTKGAGYRIFLNQANRCYPSITSSKPLNRSIALSENSSSHCGNVLALNGVPIMRTWDSKSDFTLSNLEKNTAYNIAIYSNEHQGLGTKVAKSIRTLSGDDFKISSIENIGDIANNTYKRRYTFTRPYATDSAGNIVLSIDTWQFGKTIPATITKVSDRSFDIIPSSPLYFNASYSIDGLDKLKDTVGNPLYSYDWSSGYIQFGPNPATEGNPGYGYVYTPVGPKVPESSISVIYNFPAKSILDHINPKYDNLLAYLNSIALEKNGTIPAIEVTRLGAIVKSCISASTDACKSYDLNGDGKVNLDDATFIGDFWKKGTSYTDLMFKYEKISVTRYDDSTYGGIKIKSTASAIKDDALEILFPDGLPKGNGYAVTVPYLVDDLNNLIPAGVYRFNVE